MHTSGESSYLQNQCTVRKNKQKKRKQGDKWIHAHQSRSAAYTSGRGSSLPVQDCLVVLDVPALQHAACGGVLVMVQHLRLAEVHCMSSPEQLLCQSGSLVVPMHSSEHSDVR